MTRTCAAPHSDYVSYSLRNIRDHFFRPNRQKKNIDYSNELHTKWLREFVECSMTQTNKLSDEFYAYCPFEIIPNFAELTVTILPRYALHTLTSSA